MQSNAKNMVAIDNNVENSTVTQSHVYQMS
mgnify:CR=1 FL=1